MTKEKSRAAFLEGLGDSMFCLFIHYTVDACILERYALTDWLRSYLVLGNILLYFTASYQTDHLINLVHSHVKEIFALTPNFGTCDVHQKLLSPIPSCSQPATNSLLFLGIS